MTTLKPLNYMNNISKLMWAVVNVPNTLSKEALKTIVYEINKIGSRKSSKTYTDLDFATDALFLPDTKVGIYLFRAMVKDSQELWEETLDHIENKLGEDYAKLVKINHTHKTIRWGKNFIKVMGVSTTRKGKVAKTGLRRLKGFDWAITMFEEAFEFSEAQRQDINEAIGGYNRLVELNDANPWLRSNPFINRVYQRTTPTLAIMQEHHQLFKSYIELVMVESGEIDKDGNPIMVSVGNKVIIDHWSNHNINTHISPLEHSKLEKLKDLNYQRWLISAKGLPGSVMGSIFGGLKDKVGTVDPNGRQPEVIIGGVDLGRVNSATTTGLLGFTHKLRNLNFYGLYYHSNRDNPKTKSPLQMLNEICKFWKRMVKKYDWLATRGVIVKVDNAQFSAIETLNKLARVYGISKVVEFEATSKWPVLERLDIMSMYIEAGGLKVNREPEEREYFKEFWKEFEMYIWDADKLEAGEYEPVKDWDHIWDMIFYSLSEHMYDMVEDWQESRLYVET